jgi:hypothetical protein
VSDVSSGSRLAADAPRDVMSTGGFVLKNIITQSASKAFKALPFITSVQEARV